MKTVAIFDFCDTLVNLQSADRFIEFATKQHRHWLGQLAATLRKPLKRLGIMPNWLGKRMVALQLRGLSEEAMEPVVKGYVDEVLIPAQNKVVMQKLLEHRRRGDTVCIVSAGYTPYVQEFAKRYDVSCVIATDLQTKNHRYTGRLAGKNCYGKNKVKKLSAVVPLDQIHAPTSHVYSDELSDLPLFNLVQHKHFVTSSRRSVVALPDGFTALSIDGEQ